MEVLIFLSDKTPLKCPIGMHTACLFFKKYEFESILLHMNRDLSTFAAIKNMRCRE